MLLGQAAQVQDGFGAFLAAVFTRASCRPPGDKSVHLVGENAFVEQRIQRALKYLGVDSQADAADTRK